MLKSFPHALMVRRLACVALVLFLSACGGGGSGDGDGGGGSGGGLSVSPTSLVFSATASATTPSLQIVTVNISDASAASIVAGFPTGITPPSWIDLSIISASLPTSTVGVAVNTTSLAVGSHSTTVRIGIFRTDNSLIGYRDVSVTYNVSAGSTFVPSPTSLTYTIGDSPVAADFTRQVTVTSNGSLTWTAASNVAWLQISPLSGDTGASNQLTASLDQTQIASFGNGAYEATITFTPSSGSTVTVPVTVTINRTQVNYVSPYVGIENTPANFIIRGNNFSAVTITGVSFVGTSTLSVSCPGTDCIVVGDTEVRVTAPSMPAGTYAVRLDNTQGANTTYANLVMVAAPTLSAATLNYPSMGSFTTIRSMEYDAERKALVAAVVLNSDSGLLRFPYTTSWQTPVLTATNDMVAATLAPDGKNWLMLFNSGFRAIDANTYTVGALDSASLSTLEFTGMAVTNDGRALLTTRNMFGGFSTMYRYAIPTAALTATTRYAPFYNPLFGALPGAAADGSLVSILQRQLTPTPAVTLYNASTASASQPGLSANGLPSNEDAYGRHPVVDRNGKRVTIISSDPSGSASSVRTNVYDESMTLLGALPDGTQAVIFAPNPTGAATRVYTYENTSPTCRLRAFDLTSVSSGSFDEIVTAPYPITVTCVGPSHSLYPKMAITPDGATTFVGGNERIIAVSTP